MPSAEYLVGDLNLRVSDGRLDSVQGVLGLSFGDDDGIWLGPGFSLVFALLVLPFLIAKSSLCNKESAPSDDASFCRLRGIPTVAGAKKTGGNEVFSNCLSGSLLAGGLCTPGFEVLTN